MVFKQTWWDNNLPNRFDEFNSWIGDKNAQSKVFFRNFIKDGNYKSLIDLGCGTATEYFAYKEEYPELIYLGIDSSEVLYENNHNLGVPMKLSSAEDTNLPDNFSEAVFSRHVLEHQPSFKPVLNEMIRLASEIVIHVFFITPKDNVEHIGYDSVNNLYHNRYCREDINNYLMSNGKIESFEWKEINDVETALIIKIK